MRIHSLTRLRREVCRIRPLILGVAPSWMVGSSDGWNFYDEAVIVIIGSGGGGIVLALLSPSA